MAFSYADHTYAGIPQRQIRATFNHGHTYYSPHHSNRRYYYVSEGGIYFASKGGTTQDLRWTGTKVSEGGFYCPGRDRIITRDGRTSTHLRSRFVIKIACSIRSSLLQMVKDHGSSRNFTQETGEGGDPDMFGLQVW